MWFKYLLSIKYFFRFFRIYLTCHEKEFPKIGEAGEKPKSIFKALPTFKDVFGNIANLQNLLVICHHQYAPLFVRFYQSKLFLLGKETAPPWTQGLLQDNRYEPRQTSTYFFCHNMNHATIKKKYWSAFYERQEKKFLNIWSENQRTR